jgi:hypothetical protein
VVRRRTQRCTGAVGSRTVLTMRMMARRVGRSLAAVAWSRSVAARLAYAAAVALASLPPPPVMVTSTHVGSEYATVPTISYAAARTQTVPIGSTRTSAVVAVACEGHTGSSMVLLGRRMKKL